MTRLHRTLRAVSTSVMLLWAGVAAAGSDSAAPFDHGLFWQITAPSGTTAAMVGTLHIDDARVAQINQRALELLTHAHTLVEEVSSDDLFSPALGQSMFSGPPLSEQLPKATYDKAISLLSAHGITAEQAQHMQLWAAWLILELPEKTGPGLDMQLLIAKESKGEAVQGLERINEQIDALRNLPVSIQKTIVTDLVNHPDVVTQSLQDTIDAYAAQDLQRLYTQLQHDPDEVSLSHEERELVLDRILWQRNHRMVEHLHAKIEQGCTLVAIGALHLPGVLHELSQQGYTIRPLPDNARLCPAASPTTQKDKP